MTDKVIKIMNQDDRELEQHLKDLGLDNPRVTPEKLDSVIEIIDTFILSDALRGLKGTNADLVTVAVLTLRNGFVITATSACAHRDNFNVEIGRELAIKEAKSKIWQFEGYALRNDLALVERASPPSSEHPNNATYIGTKVVHAYPLSRGAYNELRGWDIPPDEDADEEGYLVEYAEDRNHKNLPGFAGYVSWSPKDVFEKSYRKV